MAFSSRIGNQLSMRQFYRWSMRTSKLKKVQVKLILNKLVGIRHLIFVTVVVKYLMKCH